ncbi:TPA: hypothetical protein NOS95_001924 [Pseudomonas aeruginosa]|uniref:hypothetical protein n=1 Tax=Pseudomonas aeruginosa TaxID=287 RepID=UPI001067FCE8|nr:hypothetical protein [Pseudomonas aeruginosa]MBY9588979.1 hypothetical protein [Pseudomonas aeruginosa]MBY9640884.1 hypothetical protein [Pseudomonas aeruginosa]QZV41530.1 hypothetical protein KUU70_24030 [Pseudomonas aeruginosa]TEB92445.1 hypothetical protein IPC1601_17715 [Pseudomonas aeruginosa]HCI1891370.1 hypothetical protein [Pseudomonas aeruginosa]
MPKLIPEWLWPRLTLSTTADSAQQRWLREEQDKVDQGYWADISDVALEEARRLFDAEHERRRGADSKAGLYLAAITALMPILASILPGLWDKQISTCQRGVQLGIFLLALLFLMRAGLWALKTIKISASTVVTPGDIADSFNSDGAEECLAKKLLSAVIQNYTGTNQKITCIKMTHEFLLRAFFSFLAFLAVQASWPAAVWSVGWIHNELISPMMGCSP